MRIDDELIESLLYEEEGVGLDLKSEQYRFQRASDEDKSELLKDILSFANAWRRSDAFILIGVKEVKGGKNEVIGISELLDDAAIQQFVNTKTQKPVILTYKNITFDEKQLGVIHIPVQQRPFYLKKDFGKLKKNTVYIRRGSSTDVASVDEIARMGDHLQGQTSLPELSLSFADPKHREQFADKIIIHSLYLVTPKKEDIPDYGEDRPPSGFGYQVSMPLPSKNWNYYRELVEYTRISKLVFPAFLAVTNAGISTAYDVRIELKIPMIRNDAVILNAYQYPEVPRSEIPIPSFHPTPVPSYDVSVLSYDEYWLVQAKVDKVQPKYTHWFQSPFFIGAKQEMEIDVDVTIYCDDLPEPVKQKLLVVIESESRAVNLDDIKKMERERYRNSPEGKRFMESFKDKE